MTDAGPETGSLAPLRERLHEINHWWPNSDTEYQPNRPGSIPATKRWNFYKSDFFNALSNLAWSGYNADVRLFAMTGPENTGKTTILSQILRLFVDDDFRQLLWTLPDTGDDLERETRDYRVAWAIDNYHYDSKVDGGRSDLVDELRELGPENVLYIPLAADPSFQLRPEKQIREAVAYYEEEVLAGEPSETRHYVLIDDVHASAGDAEDTGWGDLMVDLLDETSERKIVLTTLSEDAVVEELYDPERDRMRLSPDAYAAGTVASLKFRDYLQRRYPIFEGAETDEEVDIDYQGALAGEYERESLDSRNPHAYRLSGSSFSRDGVKEAVVEDDPSKLYDPNELDEPSPLTQFETQLDRIYEWAGRGAKDSPRAWIQNALDEYLLLGGYVGLSLDDALFELDDDEFQAYLRGETVSGRSFAADTRDALDDTLGTIHEQAPSFGSIRQTRIRDLSRLFAWATHALKTEPFDYDDLLAEHSEHDDWILDVDRRTLREKYFDILEQMFLLTFSDGYGHKKPRELRVVLRDIGIANALRWRDLDDVVGDTSLRRSLEYMVAFDHVMRFSYNVNDDHDPNQGVVRYWQDGDDFVEFVPKVWGAPIPIGLDTTSDTPVEKIDTVGRFLDVQSANADAEVHDFVRYEPVVGEPRTGPAGKLEKVLGWFDESVLESLRESDTVEDLRNLWEASAKELAEIDGIDRETAAELVAAVELYDVLSGVRGIGPSKQETLWNPPVERDEKGKVETDHRPAPDSPYWAVDRLADADPDRIAAIPGFTETTAERVVQAARTRQQQQEDSGEYQRRLDLVLEGNGRWSGIDERDGDGESDYCGWHETYEWGSGDEDGDQDSGEGPTHHRVHDGEAPFGIVLTGGSGVDRYESLEKEKPVFTVPLWMFLALA